MTKHSARNAILSFLTEEEAATAVEYAIMLGLIIVVCIGSIGALSEKTKESFDKSAEAINGSGG